MTRTSLLCFACAALCLVVGMHMVHPAAGLLTAGLLFGALGVLMLERDDK